MTFNWMLDLYGRAMAAERMTPMAMSAASS